MKSELSKLNAIVDVDAAARVGRDPLDLLRAFLAGGARFVQLRAKGLAGGAWLELAERCVEAAHAAGAVLIVNDRADVAALARADGVHVGQDDLPPKDVRRIVGDPAIVGFSTHTVAQIETAVREPITYVAVGPVFGTTTKDTGYERVGLELVRRAARMAAGAGLPLVAIGGITLATAPSVIEAGAASVAVIGDLLATRDPEARVRQYIKSLAVSH